MDSYIIKGKQVNIHSNGEIFVNGKFTGIKQWESSSTRYSNLSGQEQKDLKGKSLEQALFLRGYLTRGFLYNKTGENYIFSSFCLIYLF